MEPILFYGVPSGCSLGAVIALEWLAQPYRLSRIEMMQHPWPAPYAHVNPRMKTPALLLDDGDALTESAAILQLIGRRGIAQGLGFAAGTREHDRLNEMLAYLTTDYFSAYAPLWKLYDTGDNDAATRTVLRTWGEETARKECAYVDGLLADRAWLLGPQRTVADAYLYAVGRWARYHEVADLEADYPHLAAWFGRMEADPAVQFALAIERGEEPVGNGAFVGHVQIDALRARLAA